MKVTFSMPSLHVVDAKSGQRLRHTSLAGFDKGKEAYGNYIEYYVM